MAVERRKYFMINLYESIRLARDRTRDPRICSQNRGRLNRRLFEVPSAYRHTLKIHIVCYRDVIIGQTDDTQHMTFAP